MPSFLTQCPHCLTSFRVTGKQLDAAEGLVRCGACLGIFSAEANRITVKPTPEEAAAAEARELAPFDDYEAEDMETLVANEADVLTDAPVNHQVPDVHDEVNDIDGPEELYDAEDGDEPAGLDEADDFEEPEELDETDDFEEPEGFDDTDDSDETEELDEADDFEESEDLDEIEEELGETEDVDEAEDSAAPLTRPMAMFATESADDDDDDDNLLEPGDFDIQLGDLNLDLDDDYAVLSDEDEAGEDEEGDDDSEYDDEDEDEDEPAYNEFADDDSDEDEDASERPANAVPGYVPPAESTRLIDIVYEEYADEEVDEDVEEDEPSEEFEPDFIFNDDDPLDARTAYAATHDLAINEDDAELDDDDEDALDDVDDEAAEERNDELDADQDLELDEDEFEEEFDEEIRYEAPPPHYRGSADKSALRNYLADIEDDDALDPLDDEALAALEEPVLLEAAPRRSRVAVFALLVANLALLGLLAWQYADANIERLVNSTRFAPVLPFACSVLDCPEPQRAQPELFVSEQLLVRSHPRYAQALEVNLVFRNDAPEAQPFPALELGLLDPSNRMVANRLFQPAEYLPPELQAADMPAQSSMQVTLELVDPGSDAVNYTLGFRAP
jgi:predicted Zn finger-like uncharacterized protein